MIASDPPVAPPVSELSSSDATAATTAAIGAPTPAPRALAAASTVKAVSTPSESAAPPPKPFIGTIQSL
jgi:hypothetical protein